MATITSTELGAAGRYIDLGDVADTSIAQTLLVYYRPTGSQEGGFGYFFGRVTSGSVNGHRAFLLNSGNAIGYGGSSTGAGERPYINSSTSTWSNDVWAHSAFTWDGTVSSSGFVSYHGAGVALTATGTSSPTNGSGTPTNGVGKNLYLMNRDGLGRGFVGDLAYVARWNRVLTLTELQDAQTNGPLSVPSGLILCWANQADLGPNAYTPVARSTYTAGALPPNTALGGGGPVSTTFSVTTESDTAVFVGESLSPVSTTFSVTTESDTAVFVGESAMLKGVTITLYDAATPQASITGIRALWWDAPEPAGLPDYETTTASTDGSGVLTLDLNAVTSLAIDDPGFLLLYKLDGTDHRDSAQFAGRVLVSNVV